MRDQGRPDSGLIPQTGPAGLGRSDVQRGAPQADGGLETESTVAGSWRALARLTALVEDVVGEPLRAEIDITLAQFEVLQHLPHPPGVAHVLDLERVLGWHHMRIIYEIRRLERRGLLRRATERRRLVLSLTSEGAAILESARRAHRKALTDLLTHHLSDAENRALEQLGREQSAHVIE